ncbi:hypothetical protein LCGC14_1699050 [marine sediment metagenome]|uniref:N-acetyltransferase domain-containing protein n=1 Tax=marine sediment metagenome TaxID=412755 RepID=A0A0F9HIA2_9ZZZZ
MLSEQIFSENAVSLEQFFPNFTHEFLKPFENLTSSQVKNEMHLNFEIKENKHLKKISPILRLAHPSDAKQITEIYKELYNGTYPYKEMEDVEEVKKMILDPHVKWIIYQDPQYNIAGCITFVLDFQNRRGYIRGFMLKRKYQGRIDITKAMIGSMLGMLHEFRDTIYTWYVENRTAHAKSQYSMWVCGITPIAFYPNKDIFLEKIESDLMQILYDERALKKFRSSMIPCFIPSVESCYQYSNKRYSLGTFSIKSPNIILGKKKVGKLQKKLKRNIVKDKFGYETITFSFEGFNSYFRFLHTPQVKNMEKIKYEVKNLEELYVFTQELIKCKKEFDVRYCEVFVSAYNPEHQQIFYDAGLKPRGYIPSWECSPDVLEFNDSILFSIFNGNVSENIQLIDQGHKLLEALGFSDDNIAEPISYQTYSFVEVASRTSSLMKQKAVKRGALAIMFTYLTLLCLSIITAVAFGPSGFSFIVQTISDLGNSQFTPAPYLFDFACIMAGMVTIPYSFFCDDVRKSPQKHLDLISRFGLFFGILGGVGYICVGVFSLERAGPNGFFHAISAIVAFTGFVFSIVFFSLHALIQGNLKVKLLGICGIMIPLTIFILNGVLATPLIEWFLLFSILFYTIPLNYLSLH